MGINKFLPYRVNSSPITEENNQTGDGDVKSEVIKDSGVIWVRQSENENTSFSFQEASPSLSLPANVTLLFMCSLPDT